MVSREWSDGKEHGTCHRVGCGGFGRKWGLAFGTLRVYKHFHTCGGLS